MDMALVHMGQAPVEACRAYHRLDPEILGMRRFVDTDRRSWAWVPAAFADEHNLDVLQRARKEVGLG